MDIVERARVRNIPYGYLELLDKLADEIERLRTALQWIADASLRNRMCDDLGYIISGIESHARKVLSNDENQGGI